MSTEEQTVRGTLAKPNMLRLFLASPGDTDLERKQVRAVVDELNQALKRTPWRVEVLGWEERGPTAGRPQADINPDLDLCDVFVGIVWGRLGTPTGDHDSGFVEEWERARNRHKRTGQPDLWLFLREITDDAPASEDERAKVLALRQEIEDAEAAFHKPYAEPEGFVVEFRKRLLSEFYERSGLSSADLDLPTAPWESTAELEPVSLLPDGAARRQAADQLVAQEPGEAAKLFAELADDAESRNYERLSTQLRMSASHALIAADAIDQAIAIFRRVAADQLWIHNGREVLDLTRSVRGALPPELSAELDAWALCAQATDEPDALIRDLPAILEAEHPFAIDERTRKSWLALYWRCLLDAGNEGTILEVEEPPGEDDLSLELRMLWLEARSSTEPDSNSGWEKLWARAVARAKDNPPRTAWIGSRRALGLFAREQFDEAEKAYREVAARWATIPGREEMAAAAFFSAQAVARIKDPWSFTGWDWQPIAYSQRSQATTFVSRARDLQDSVSFHLRADEPTLAYRPAKAAVWLSQRAGMLEEILRAITRMADVEDATGDDVAAARLNCLAGNHKRAAKIARVSQNRVEICRALSGDWPGWTREARIITLKEAGGSAPADVVDDLVNVALEELEVEQEMSNRAQSGAEALAAMAPAVESHDVRNRVVDALRKLAGDQRYTEASSGRAGLRLLADCGHFSGEAQITELITLFALDRRADDPSPGWIAKRLTTADRIAVVRHAALAGGHDRALFALIEAEIPKTDPELRAACGQIAAQELDSDLGRTEDGSIRGFHDVGALGDFAHASDDRDLGLEVAETLLLYAAEARWPLFNRGSALGGLWPLREWLDPAEWLDRLKPFVEPTEPLGDEKPDQVFGSPQDVGSLRAGALQISTWLAGADPPTWLIAALERALFSDEKQLRAGAWYALSIARFENAYGTSPLGVLDPEREVKIAALACLQRRADGPIPEALAARLLSDQAVSVRLHLTAMAEKHKQTELITRLTTDEDGYVRGVARVALGQLQAESQKNTG